MGRFFVFSYKILGFPLDFFPRIVYNELRDCTDRSTQMNMLDELCRKRLNLPKE